jgi:hypothetical protein
LNCVNCKKGGWKNQGWKNQGLYCVVNVEAGIKEEVGRNLRNQ